MCDAPSHSTTDQPGNTESAPSVSFRPATDRDVGALVALWTVCGLTRAWNDPLRDIAFARAGPTSEMLVGAHDGAIVASVMVGHDGHRGAVYYLAVDPAWQGRKLGQLAMAAAEDWLKARGVWKLNLMVRRENARVAGFYERLGYEASDVVVMGKWLG